jgi:hypothetical protein
MGLLLTLPKILNKHLQAFGIQEKKHSILKILKKQESMALM